MANYPVKKTGNLKNNAILEVAFRPDYPGVINLMSWVWGIPLTLPSDRRRKDPPSHWELALRFELFQPGNPTPILSETRKIDANEENHRFLLFQDYQAGTNELTGEKWIARMTNLSGPSITLNVELNIRYQTVEGNRGKIEHIVILMMENRSFDHLLGYLKLIEGRSDIDGLTAEKANEYEGRSYPVHPLTSTVFCIDPGHSGEDVAEQIDNGSMGGFVRNFATTLASSRNPESESLDAVMGYHTKDQVPTYDFLAREFLVCDRWFSSVPGATWPNRLYSLTGSSGGIKSNPKINIQNPPGYELKTIFEFLQERGIDWTSYFSDFPFPLIYKKLVQDAAYTQRIKPMYEFFKQAANGELPQVSWLDPNFQDLPDKPGNDDHPPSDILQGQRFVAEVLNVLAKSPLWSKTLFILTYDEHGGFYDHVPPPKAEDDDASMQGYGVRVPAFVISPWVAKGDVSSQIFDHASILKTILLRFLDSDGPDRAIPSLGRRVDQANDLFPLLREEKLRIETFQIPLPPIGETRDCHALTARSTDEFSRVLRRTIVGI